MEAPKGKKPIERPKYDVTCSTCGIATQVPFVPLAGRDIYCKPCYQARRGLPKSGSEGASAATNGAGDAREDTTASGEASHLANAEAPDAVDEGAA